MNAAQECRDCLKGLGSRMAQATARNDIRLAKLIDDETSLLVRQKFRKGRTAPPRLATLLFRRAIELSGVTDPFAPEKLLEFKSGAKAAKRLSPLFSPDLAGRMQLSVAGNRLDFFRDLAEVEAEWRGNITPPAIDDSEALGDLIAPGVKVLLCADNPGELPFDLSLIEELDRLGCRVSYAVKGLPSQNDLTFKDVKRFGVELADHGATLIDTGVDWVGCDLDRVGENFKEAWRTSDIVIAKGMANLETLTRHRARLKRKKVFFALVAKCRPLADFIGVNVGDCVLLDGQRLI